MNTATKQILQLAQNGLEASEIAGALGFEVSSVEVILGCDGAVNKELVEERKTSVDTKRDNSIAKLDQEFEERQSRALTVLDELLERSDNDIVRFKCATYILDQRLGLKVPVKSNTYNTFNVLEINETLSKARALSAKLDGESVDDRVIQLR